MVLVPAMQEHCDSLGVDHAATLEDVVQSLKRLAMQVEANRSSEEESTQHFDESVHPPLKLTSSLIDDRYLG